MTRINVIAVQDLTDKHLLAEYKEITRITAGLRKSLAALGKNAVITVPPRYCLGLGHMKFFYTRMAWIADRYTQLAAELQRRGFSLDQAKFSGYLRDMLEFRDTPYWNDYTPTPEDKYLNMARLVKRSKIDAVIEEMYSGN